MGMLLPYWRPEQILREEELQEKEDAPRWPWNFMKLQKHVSNAESCAGILSMCLLC